MTQKGHIRHIKSMTTRFPRSDEDIQAIIRSNEAAFKKIMKNRKSAMAFIRSIDPDVDKRSRAVAARAKSARPTSRKPA